MSAQPNRGDGDGVPYKLGDRVLAAVNGTGYPRRGVVSTVMQLPTGTHSYMVTFAGDHGQSGPCQIVEYE